MIGKTGTTDEAYATWMSGASSKVATVAGVYNASGFTNLRNVDFGGSQAAVIRHTLWPDVMNVANAKYGGDAFPRPRPGRAQCTAGDRSQRARARTRGGPEGARGGRVRLGDDR